MQQVIKTLHMQHNLEIAERQKLKKQGRDDHLKELGIQPPYRDIYP